MFVQCSMQQSLWFPVDYFGLDVVLPQGFRSKSDPKFLFEQTAARLQTQVAHLLQRRILYKPIHLPFANFVFVIDLLSFVHQQYSISLLISSADTLHSPSTDE